MADQHTRLLVFGGTGQLGCELSRSASINGVALHAPERQSAEITSFDAVRKALVEWRPSVVVNAAGFTRVDDSEIHPSVAEQGNARGPGVVAEACEAARIPLIHISTDYVFDGQKSGAYTETDPVSPLGVYGRTKAAGEVAVRDMADRHIIIRTAWLYGEFGQNFLKTILRQAHERDLLRVVDDQWGCPTSSRDLAQAILRILPRLEAKDVAWGTYHFAGDGATTWHGFATRAAARLAALTGRRLDVKPITTDQYPTRAKRPRNSMLDCSKFEREFGFKGRPWGQEVDDITDILVRLRIAETQPGSAMRVSSPGGL